MIPISTLQIPISKLNSNFKFNLNLNWVEFSITFVLYDHPTATRPHRLVIEHQLHLQLQFLFSVTTSSLTLSIYTPCKTMRLWCAIRVRARKSIVSWYPGYQPMSNLAANFGWAKGTASHHLRINSQLLAGPMATKVY